MIFRHPQEYIKLENCRFSIWTENGPFQTEGKRGEEVRLEKETVQMYSSNDRHELSTGKASTITDFLLFID